MHGSCLQILVDLLARYIKNLGIEMQRRAECCNRTEANLIDVQRVFAEVGITSKELEEYVENFDTKETIGKCAVVRFPAPADNNLNFLKPGSREVLHRKVHVNEYFPPMYPELEEEADSGIGRGSTVVVSPRVDERSMSVGEGSDPVVKKEFQTGSSAEGGEFLEPMPPAQMDPQDTKRELSTTMDGTSSEIMSHLRDIPSVMMTSAGFISPAREGKLPESRTPHGGASAAAAAALREEREEEMRSLQRMQKKAMMAEEAHRRQVSSGAGQKQDTVSTRQDTAVAPIPAPVAVSACPSSGSNPENRKKLAIFQKKSGGSSSKVVKKQLSTKAPPEGAKVVPSISTAKKAAKIVAPKKASSVGSSGTKIASTKVVPSVPTMSAAAQGQQAQRKKRGKAPMPISAEIVPDSPPSSPSPPPSPTPPPQTSVELEKIHSLTLPPPPPAQPPAQAISTVPESSSGAVDNPLIPRAANFYGFDLGERASGSADKHQKDEKIKIKEKKKKNKKDKLRDKKKKTQKWSSPSGASTSVSSSTEITPSTCKSVPKPGVPKITFRGIGNDNQKQEAEKKVVIKPVVPPSSSAKGEKKRRLMGPGATDDGDAFQMMFKEPLKIDRPSARPVDPKKGRKRQISGGGKNASAIVTQSQTPKRRKTGDAEPSSASAASKGTTAPTVTSSTRRQRTSTSAEAIDDSSSKDGDGGGITVTQPVGHYVDEDGKEIWICPACGEQYNHLPMICCDRCDEWYHWMCVGISSEPDESQDWYCMRCVSEIKKETNSGKKNVKEKKKR